MGNRNPRTELMVGAAAVGATATAATAGKVLLERRFARQRGRAYRLQGDESVPDGIRRVARGQIDTALEHLGDGGDRETAVHEARKSLKRLRTLLRVAVRAHDPRTYRRENDAFRDVGRRLGVARDSKVMIDTLDHVGERYRPEMPEDGVGRFRSTLTDEHEQALRRLDGDGAVTGSAIEDLEAARVRVAAWSFPHDDFRTLKPGLRRIYRRGRKAYRRARRDPSTENLHELRKRAKDLRYATQLVRDAAPSRRKRIGKLRSRAKDVSDLLGDDHDLAVLRTRALEKRREFSGDPAALTALEGLLDRRRARLRRKALDEAKDLYSGKAPA